MKAPSMDNILIQIITLQNIPNMYSTITVRSHCHRLVRKPLNPCSNYPKRELKTFY
jgi:hypothetical protein